MNNELGLEGAAAAQLSKINNDILIPRSILKRSDAMPKK